MSELSLSDQLDGMELEDIEEGAKAAIEAMKKSLTNSYEHMIRVGHFLNAMKARLPHGAWGNWLRDNFDDSQSWAARLMACAADRANLKSTSNLTTVSTIEQHYSMLMNSPEKQAKRAEREAKKLQAPPKPPAPPAAAPAPAQPAKLERPEWLADPDELEHPEETDLPPLPRTNTHHTSANRRTPDARETDRAGIVCPDDPRGVVDGGWYVWSEEANRLLPLTDDDILRRADQIRGRVVECAGTTSPVVEHKTEFVSSKPGKVPTLSQLLLAVEGKTDWTHALRESARDWAAYKMTLAGKDKIRSMESWQKALTRMGNVARDRDVATVCEAIEKAIANGWTGWEHLETSGSRPRGAAGGRVYQQLQKAQVKYDPLPE